MVSSGKLGCILQIPQKATRPGARSPFSTRSRRNFGKAWDVTGPTNGSRQSAWLAEGEVSKYPLGKLHDYQTSPFFNGKIHITIFNSYVKLPEGMSCVCHVFQNIFLMVFWCNVHGMRAFLKPSHFTNSQNVTYRLSPLWIWVDINGAI